jgi:16S rRNA (uracil1498-N3)-methyltransferase
MNLLLLLPEDFVGPGLARLTGRRSTHVREVHRAGAGDSLKVGLLDGGIGAARVVRAEGDTVELELGELDLPPPAKLPLTLVLALPRPKVLNRVLASATSLGVARIVLLNAWRVEKAYWKSPRLGDENLRHQRILGLEQAGDTVLPELHLARLFRPFVEHELPALAAATRCLAAHPGATTPCPRGIAEPVTLAIGPEGGWIEPEVESLRRAGFTPVDLGPRILRSETALAALVGRLF